ncbi:MAG: DegT/DnrJ/EryC1/StrS family aminotransferase [Kiritimatiellae bacterium]|nr:DegT/DnrJ/EryC1/StrS family aminotransferase [Kiritimatiellia bacterium]
MRDGFLPFSPPCLDEDEIAEVSESLRSGWITTGPKCRAFEAALAARLGSPAALAVNSCTAALHTALAVLGVGPGDEVITSALTFCSTVSVIEHVGATPVLVDVEPDTLNLDPAAVAAAVSERTRVLLPVHYGGHPCDMDALWAVARKHDLAVLEDAAHALPARYRGRWIGQGDNPVAFSFYATKNVTTGEGGMLTGAPEFIDEARIASLHGMSRDAWRRHAKGGSWYYEVVMPGFKYNLPDVLAAIGLAQLRKLDRMQARRREVVAAYTAALADLPLRLPVQRPECESAWHLYSVRLLPEAPVGRDEFVQRLAAANIGTSVHFIPIHYHPYYREKYGWQPGAFPVTEEAYRGLVSLPLHGGLATEGLERIVEAAVQAIGAK